MDARVKAHECPSRTVLSMFSHVLLCVYIHVYSTPVPFLRTYFRPHRELAASHSRALSSVRPFFFGKLHRVSHFVHRVPHFVGKRLVRIAVFVGGGAMG